MIRYSKSVSNVLDRLFIEGASFGNKRSWEQYEICIRNLDNLCNRTSHEKATSPRSWAESGSASLYECRAGDYTFGYSLYSDGIFVEEVMYQGRIIDEEVDNNPDISELEQFHSWMKRLDEVKGARPTFWC